MNKIEILNLLKEEVCNCVKCPILAKTRRKTVFDSGNSNARLMCVAEAPGNTEDLQGEVLVGKAGQLFTNILKAHGFTRDEVYLCNVLKCRTPNNRVPAAEEIANCFDFLERQIEAVNPEFIVCLGSVASQRIVGLPISQARRKWFDYKGRRVWCVWHPSYLLRNPEAKKLVREDFNILVKAMNSNVMV